MDVPEVVVMEWFHLGAGTTLPEISIFFHSQLLISNWNISLNAAALYLRPDGTTP